MSPNLQLPFWKLKQGGTCRFGHLSPSRHLPFFFQKMHTSFCLKVDGDLDFDFPFPSFPFSLPLPLPPLSALPFGGCEPGRLSCKRLFLVWAYGQFAPREQLPWEKNGMHHPFSLANFLSAVTWFWALLGAAATGGCPAPEGWFPGPGFFWVLNVPAATCQVRYMLPFGVLPGSENANTTYGNHRKLVDH